MVKEMLPINNLLHKQTYGHGMGAITVTGTKLSLSLQFLVKLGHGFPFCRHLALKAVGHYLVQQGVGCYKVPRKFLPKVWG